MILSHQDQGLQTPESPSPDEFMPPPGRVVTASTSQTGGSSPSSKPEHQTSLSPSPGPSSRPDIATPSPCLYVSVTPTGRKVGQYHAPSPVSSPGPSSGQLNGLHVTGMQMILHLFCKLQECRYDL